MCTSIVCTSDYIPAAGRHVQEELVVDEVLLVKREQVLFKVIAYSDCGDRLTAKPHVPKLHTQVVSRNYVIRVSWQKLRKRQ